MISLSFALIKDQNYEDAKDKINWLIVELYVKYRYLREADCMSEADREFFDSVRADMPEAVSALALRKLSDFLYRYYGKKFSFCWMSTIHLCRKPM